MTHSPFPRDFLWGTATAGHQNEGNNTNSDTWFLENVTPTIFREPSGLADNGYQLWEADLDLVAGMGLNSYRFSVEWARIEPIEGTFDQDALAHYEAIIDGCIARGLAPIVTFSHFTAPHWFAKDGGFLDSRSADRFAALAEVVMSRFGDRIAYAMTLNEPNLPMMLAWVLPDFVVDLTRATLAAASEKAGVERYRAGNVVQPEDFEALTIGFTSAHRAAKAVIKRHRPELPVGFSIAIADDVADGDATVRDRKRAEAYNHWLELAREDDFIGVQNYERIHYGKDAVTPAPAGSVMNEMGSAVDPASLGGAVRYAYEVAQVPILVTEHGVGTADDAVRVGFIEPSLDGLHAAMDDGVPVIGYLHWTLMDNFEWVGGYGSQLGLHEVDRETFVRTAKPSAAEYARLVALNRS